MIFKLDMNKNIKTFILAILFCCLTHAASFNILSNECSGQLLYVWQNGQPQLYAFRKLLEKPLWECMNFDTNLLEQLNCSQITVLPFYEDIEPFAVNIVASHFAMLPLAQRERLFLKIYMVLQQKKATKTGTLFGIYLRHEDNEIREIAKLMKKFLNESNINIEKRDIAEEIVSNIEESDCISELETIVNEGDFFMACSLLLRFNALVTDITSSLPSKYNNQIRKIFDNWSEAMSNSLIKVRDNCKAREEAFSSIFPSAHGAWNESVPLDLEGLKRLCSRVYDSFSKTIQYSEYSEFELWGNSMLDVLMLLPGDAVSASPAKQFDEALKRHKEQFGL